MKNYTITVNGNVYEVSVEEGGEGSTPKAAAPKAVPKAAPKAVSKATVAGAQGAIKVNSPMPGKIIAIKENQGASVKKGQVILILEAMKMENEIVAPQDGTIASVNVSVGQTVEAGEILATLN